MLLVILHRIKKRKITELIRLLYLVLENFQFQITFSQEIQYKVTLDIDQRYVQCRKQANKQNIASTENSVLLVLQQLSKIIMLWKDVDVDYV